MARQVVFRPEAEDEVLEAREWYEARRSGLGKEFAQAVDETVSRIIEHPLAYQRAHKETRRAVLSRFPFAVYYRIAGEEVVVQAVHGRQDPSRWRSRSKFNSEESIKLRGKHHVV